MLDDFPPARIAFERFGHLLAELAQPDAAALAAGARRWLDDALDGQIVWQLARSTWRTGAPVLGGAWRSDLGLGLFLGLRRFEIFDRQFELLDKQLAALRRLTEHLASRPGEHEFQPLDFQSADLRFALRNDPQQLLLRQHLALREDHRVGASEVVGEIFGSRRHEPK